MHRALLAAGATVAVVSLTTSCGGVTHSTGTRAQKRSPQPQSFADLVARVRSGVIRIEADTCDGKVIGTGFLLTPTLVATVHHVVAGATGIELKRGSKVLGTGTVIGGDPKYDLALVRASSPIHGFRFQLADRAPRLGEDVAVIGFPFGLPLSVTRGSVSGLGRQLPIEGAVRHNLVQTDAAVNQGNSGGPLLTDDGRVVGLVDIGTTEANGLAFAISAKTAAPLLSVWRQEPVAQEATLCGYEPAPQPTPTDSGPTHVATFDGSSFSIDYPSTWSVETSEADKGAYLDTSIRGSDGVLLRIDVTPSPTEDLQSLTNPLIDAISQQAGYQELDLSSISFSGYDALRWEFLVEEQGQLLHKVDIFFIGGYGDEFAVLTQSNAEAWKSYDGVFDAIRQTFADH